MSARMSWRRQAYSQEKYVVAVVETVYLVLLLLSSLRFGWSRSAAAFLEARIHGPWFSVPVFIAVLSLSYYLLTFPLNLYSSFILEHKYRLSNQSVFSWLRDQAKAGLVAYIIGVFIAFGFYGILATCKDAWWLAAACFWVLCNVLLAKVAPLVIIPLFFKYSPLSDDGLRERIKALATRMGVEILDCYEIDFSKKTLKANAAFVGWGRSRRVLLADTLKGKYSGDEIEVILAHEFAHFRLGHLKKLVVLNAVSTAIVFYLVYLSSAPVLAFFGLGALSEVAALPLVILYFVLFDAVSRPFVNWVSRSFERSADALALRSTGNREAFISMMEKLGTQNLADRSVHPLIKAFFFTHPPVDERIAFARSFPA